MPCSRNALHAVLLFIYQLGVLQSFCHLSTLGIFNIPWILTIARELHPQLTYIYIHILYIILSIHYIRSAFMCFNVFKIFTCSKSIIETPEKSLKYVQMFKVNINYTRATHQNDVNRVILVSLLLTLNIFHIFF